MTNVITAEFFNVSLKCLRIPTLRIISNLLNPIKHIPTKDNLPRDWRGLADLMGYNQEDISSFQCTPDSTLNVLRKWSECEGYTVKMFLLFLEKMDRFDVYDDIILLIIDDIKSHKLSVRQNIDTSKFFTVRDRELQQQGLPPKQYDASILYADDDAKFAADVVTILEQQYKLDIFLKERDLIGGTIEHEATMQVIAKRSNRLIIILSPAFLESSENKYFTSFAQSIGIEQRRRKIIPCIYKHCEIPFELKPLHKLDYRRSGILYNFYEKLYSSVIPVETIPLPRSAENTPVPSRLTLTVPEVSAKSIKEHSSLPDLSIKSDTPTSDANSNTISRSSLSQEESTPTKKTMLTKLQKIFKKKQKLVTAS